MASNIKINKYAGFIQALPNHAKADPARVILVLNDGSEMPILHKGEGINMLKHIGADVELEAFIEQTPTVEGGEALKVRSYIVTDGYEDPWYDDES